MCVCARAHVCVRLWLPVNSELDKLAISYISQLELGTSSETTRHLIGVHLGHF